MAFPSSGGTREGLAKAYYGAKDEARRVKDTSIDLRDRSASGPISAKEILDYNTQLADALDKFNKSKSVPGILQYAKDQESDQNLDIAAEFTSMLNTCVNTRDWIVANFPADGSGNLSLLKFDVNGRFVFNTWPSAATAPLRTQLNALIATID